MPDRRAAISVHTRRRRRAALKLAALPLALAASAPAFAADSAFFATCDGLAKPSGNDTGVGRAASSQFGLSPQAQPEAIVAACTTALADERLRPEQNLRRISLLRARAAALLRQANYSAALADLDRAEAAAGPLAAEPLYARSLGVSLVLLRALAVDAMDRAPEAASLAAKAMRARPYGEDVQRVAAHLQLADLPSVDPSAIPALIPNRLDKTWMAQEIALLAFQGQFAKVAMIAPADFAAQDTAPALQAGQPSDMAEVGAQIARARSARSSVVAPLLVAYSRAASGDAAGARRDVDAVRRRVDPATAQGRDLAQRGNQGGYAAQLLGPSAEAIAAAHVARVEARLLLGEGRAADAAARLKDVGLPVDAVTADLLARVQAALPGRSAAAAPANPVLAKVAAAARKAARDAMIGVAMIEPETAADLDLYKRSRPNVLGALVGGALTMGTTLLSGIPKTDGFKSTDNPDGTITVEFTGASLSSSAVREATLLRAAELALAAGKTGFAVEARHDYRRVLQTSRQGVPINSQPTGFKSDLVIRWQESGPRALNARDIVAVLGPVYYREGPGASARSPARTPTR